MKDYGITRRDRELYLSETELDDYKDLRRLEIIVTEILKNITDLDKAEIQTYLISMLDQNARELNDLDKTVLANREWEKSIMED